MTQDSAEEHPGPAALGGGQPEVDVIVVSWNVRDELMGCLAAVDRSVGVKANVFVIDNASADGSGDAVRQSFPRHHLVRNPSNEGFARAANQGIRLGEAPYVLLLNPDTELPAGAIQAMIARLDALPKAAGIAPRLVDGDGNAQHSAHAFPSIGVSLLLATGISRLISKRARARLLLEGSWDSNIERDVPWVIGAVLLVPRAVFQEVGLFDERFFVYAEDLEWCDRAGRAGFSIRFNPSVVVTHSGNRSGAQRYGHDRVAAYLRNTVAYCIRRRGLAWTAAFVAINATATVSRLAVCRVLVLANPTPPRLDRLAFWRDQARYYLGRARPPVER